MVQGTKRARSLNVDERRPSKHFTRGAIRVVGVDFSGSSTEAGKLVHVADCEVESHNGTWALRVQRIRTVDEISGKREKSPQAACKVLREELLRLKAAAGPQLVVGMDSPPSVAARFIRPLSWSQWVKKFTSRYPTPEAFRNATTISKRGCSKREEPKRETDVLTKVPFAPQNLRMFRQTYNAIAGVYGPLADEFMVDPSMDLRAGKPLLFESCPASVLKRLGLYKPSYKSKGKHNAAIHEAAKRRRQQILKILEKGVAISRETDSVMKVLVEHADLKRRVVEDPGADSLDAVLAAVGAACATRSPKFPAPMDGIWRDVYSIEACVYC